MIEFKFSNKLLKVIIAETPEQRAQAYSIRYAAFMDVEYITDSSEGVKNQQFSDAIEGYSTIFLLMDDDIPVGTVRVTMAKNGPLSNEQFLKIKLDETQYLQSCELSRFALLKPYRGNLLSILLVYTAFLYCLENNIRYFYIDSIAIKVPKFYKKMGIHIIAEAQINHPFSLAKGTHHVFYRKDIGALGTLKHWINVQVPKLFVKVLLNYPNFAKFVFNLNIYSQKFIFGVSLALLIFISVIAYCLFKFT